MQGLELKACIESVATNKEFFDGKQNAHGGQPKKLWTRVSFPQLAERDHKSYLSTCEISTDVDCSKSCESIRESAPFYPYFNAFNDL